ncbi:MAG: ABC transporter ATP-binding protein [Candidatus Sericytochromatia bacterium]|nr:ABC transporter ATP-binding protein [Candidatus Sericytochromatia bacterium]
MAEIELRSVVKRYGTQPVVRDLSLRIEDGEFLVLVGASGCGKSTTLRMIAGLETADAGDLLIGQRRVNDVPPRDRDLAMVFQSYALYPHLTVADNIGFSMALRGLPRDQIRARVRQAAASLQLEALLDRKPKALSGGQRQRVALARAIVREPQAFLMDEPLSNLDAKLRAETRVELKRLHQRLGTTTVYVTHDQTEAMTMGDRIAVMQHGDVAQLATPREVYEAPANLFVAGFIGSPGMNVLRGQLELLEETPLVRLGGQTLPLAGVPVGHVADRVGREVLLGLRPETLSLGSTNGEAGLRGTVEVVEPSGSRTYVHLASEGQRLVADLDTLAIPDLRPGDQVSLRVRADQLHLFDPATERAVLHTSRLSVGAALA